MDEDLDTSIDVGTGSDLPVSESIDIEPLADIPVEESAIDTMDSLNDIEPPISEQEMSELQNEAEALAIEPLDEERNDDYFEIQGENTHNLGERIGAGALAFGALLAPGIKSAPQVRNLEPFGAPTGIYTEAPHVKQPDAYKPSPWQTAGELAGNYLDITGAIADGWRLRDNAENVGELSTALRKPDYEESSDNKG